MYLRLANQIRVVYNRLRVLAQKWLQLVCGCPGQRQPCVLWCGQCMPIYPWAWKPEPSGCFWLVWDHLCGMVQSVTRCPLQCHWLQAHTHTHTHTHTNNYYYCTKENNHTTIITCPVWIMDMNFLTILLLQSAYRCSVYVCVCTCMCGCFRVWLHPVLWNWVQVIVRHQYFQDNIVWSMESTNQLSACHAHRCR